MIDAQVVYAYNRRDPVAQQRAIDYTNALKAKVRSTFGTLTAIESKDCPGVSLLGCAA